MALVRNVCRGVTRAAATSLDRPAGTIDVFVRADGTAEQWEDATSSDSAATSLNLRTLDTESASMPAGTVIGFSSQGGNYDAANINGSPQLWNDRAIQYEGLVNIQSGLVYTNVAGELAYFDSGTIKTSHVSAGTVSVFCANAADEPGSGRVEADTSGGGGIQVECTDGLAYGLVDTWGTSGSSSAIQFKYLTCGGHYDTASPTSGQFSDIYSTNNSSSMLIVGGTVTDNYDKAGAGGVSNVQVFTSHNTSTMEVQDTVVSGFHILTAAVGGSSITMTNVTATDCYDGGSFLFLADGDTTLTDCTLDMGEGARRTTSKPVSSGTDGVGYTYLCTNCTITFSGTAATGAQAGGSFVFDGCTFNYPGNTVSANQFNNISTTNNARAWIMRDCHWNITGAQPTHLFEVNNVDPYDDLQFHRCSFDVSAPTGNWSFIRYDPPTGFSMPATTGFFACEFWGHASLNGFLRFNQKNTGASGWKFKQCTILIATASRPFIYTNNTSGNDSTTVVEFENCHFSGAGTNTDIVRADAGACTASYCGFFNTDGAEAAIQNNSPHNSVAVTTEGFTNKGSYVLEISTSSDLYQAGDSVANVGVTTDIDGRTYNSAAASIGANENTD